MKPDRESLQSRLRLFVLCLVGGAGVAAALKALTGSDWSYLAVPAALAIGWLFVADPGQCDPGAGPDE